MVKEDGGAMGAFPEGRWDGDDAAGRSRGLEALHGTSQTLVHLKDIRWSAGTPPPTPQTNSKIHTLTLTHNRF